MQQYNNIIELSHPHSPTHPRMKLSDRAAQFSSFSALVGYEDAIGETGKEVESEYQIQIPKGKAISFGH